MEQIPLQLADGLPSKCVQTGLCVHQIRNGKIVMDDGNTMPARAVVVATDGPQAARLLGSDSTEASVSETCLYFSCDLATWHPPYLLLNGDGRGPINNIAFPSRISPAYAPNGKSLVSVGVLGNPDDDDGLLLRRVRNQLVEWFGTKARYWMHLKTYRIRHALPNQAPPTRNPYCQDSRIRDGVFVCGEYGSLPGIQWALLSGRRAADAVQAHLLETPI